MLYYNNTKCTQLIYSTGTVYPTAIYPKMIVDLSGYKDINWKAFSEFDINLIEGEDCITLCREYALGDLIQLVAVARVIREKLNIKNVQIVTNERFRTDLYFTYSDIIFIPMDMLGHNIKTGFIFSLDGLLEKDHSNTNSENNKHRLDIYLEHFGITEFENNEFIWETKFKGGLNMPELKTNLKMIGLQIRGSGKMKTLPTEMIKSIADRLSQQYYVVLIDHDVNKGFEGKNILNLCGKLRPPQVIELLKRIDLCITMDSGVLWMAHSANCPTLTFLGSTREQERISLHPQYPEKAKSINLAEYVNCTPCFETMVHCKGKINCMNSVNYDMIEAEFIKKIKLILGEN